MRNLDVRAHRLPTEAPVEKSSHVIDNSKVAVSERFPLMNHLLTLI